MRRGLAAALAGLVLLWVGSATAHEIRPGFLEVQVTADTAAEVTWKVPKKGDAVLRISPRFPADCRATPGTVEATRTAVFHRFEVACETPIGGQPITIEGLERTVTDVLVRIYWPDGTVFNGRATPSNAFVIVPGEQERAESSGSGVAETYTLLGIEHILFGFDHLLFVLGLLIIIRGRWALLQTITAFTVAHSMTLALSTLGFVHVPSGPVEAVIALSIVFLAVEIVKRDEGHPTLTVRKPWLVAMVFGLLHGFGFAGALSSLGLPESSIPSALLFFNVGVELGQLSFVAAMLLLAFAGRAIVAAARTHATRPWLVDWVARNGAAYVIGGAAAFWFIERVAGLWV